MNRTLLLMNLEDNTIPEILSDLLDTFKDIDSVLSIFNKGIHNDKIQCMDILSRLTGNLQYLNSIYSEAVSSCKSDELTYYVTTRLESKDVKNKSFDDNLIKEAQAITLKKQRLINVLYGYIDNCRIGISTCKIILNSLQGEDENNKLS